MDTQASPSVVAFQGDGTLGALLDALAPQAGKALVIEYGGRRIGPGYHVTEVKAGSFVALDCGGNPDHWQETILQVEDLPGRDGRTFMAAAKFRSILGTVAARIDLAPGARLTFEVGPPGEPMQVFNVETLDSDAEHVVLYLAARPAICKPRYRAASAAPVPCCSPTGPAGCCGEAAVP